MLLIVVMTGAGAGEEKGKIRLGYWTSGVSLPFGCVLEAKKFLEKDGVDVEYVRFSDPPSSLKALTTGDIDIAFGIPLSNFFSAAHDGAPLKLVAAVQLADAVVAPEDSSVRTWRTFWKNMPDSHRKMRIMSQHDGGICTMSPGIGPH